MSSTEAFDDLEQKVSGLVEEALGEVREEFLDRLLGVRERLEELVRSEVATAREEAAAAADRAAEQERIAAEAATAEAERIAAAVAEADARGLAAVAEAKAGASRDLLRALHQAITEIDRAQSQSEVLHALLETTSEFASRTLLLLTREDGLKGWAGRGFAPSDEAIQEIHLDYALNSAWSRLAEGRGTVELGAEDCGELCRRLEAEAPRDGVLVPMVLRDRLAATLYADRTDPEQELPVTALQLLTYIAGQALETLPLRERSTTVTLRLASEAPAEEPGLELWQFAAPAPAIQEPADEELEEAVAVPVDPEEVEMTTEAGDAAAELAFETPYAEPDVLQDAEQWAVPQAVETEPMELQPAEETGFAIEEIAVEPPPVEEVELPTAYEEPPAEAAAPVWEPPAEPAPPEPVEALDEEPPVAEPLPEEAPIETLPEAPADFAEPEPVAEPIAEAPPESPPEPPAPAPMPSPVPTAAAGPQVAPPEDVEGPGWAFTTRRFTGDMGEDTAHEEARRLARLLVTEIKLYNEEQVEEGRRNRNIYQYLRDDIDRSRQIYDDRVDEAIRADTDYFREELVRILAAGDSELLGI